MTTYFLCDNEDISGEKYQDFLSLFFYHSKFFSLTSYFNNDKTRIFSQKLSKYVYKTIKTNSWYQFKVRGELLSVTLYYAHPSLKDVLIEHFGCIFPDSSLLGLQDLCFFDEKQVLFSSITHADLAQVIPSPALRPEYLKRFGKWREYVLTPRDDEFLPDFRQFV